MNLSEEGYFHEEYGIWAGHGFGTMLIYTDPHLGIHQYVLFRDEDTKNIELIDPVLYDEYLGWQ